MSLNNPTVCVLGCGTMGVAILSGIIDSIRDYESSNSETSFAPREFIACVSQEESAQRLARVFDDARLKIFTGKNVEGAAQATVILLCSKPQTAKNILTEDGMFKALENKLLISILAGVQIEQLKEWLPGSTKIIRAMPNTCCRVREGMTVLSCQTSIGTEEKAFASWVFSALGRSRFLDEKHLDAVTGLSGSGPAFACVVLEALADGGVMMGLPRDVALELAAQALQGAARMVLQTGKHPAEIKDSVTTPAGCTIAGLLTMEDGKIRSTLARTIQEATKVASTLGNVQSK
ncbi:hypothetical protein G9A89_019554 [Geosiphon pyriformis]|nr:hypothetical protein G9A89_019554 [Geosiphon pyriformis]